jgi:hypothetical protein
MELRRLADAQLAGSDYRIARPSPAVRRFDFADQPIKVNQFRASFAVTLPPVKVGLRAVAGRELRDRNNFPPFNCQYASAVILVKED